MAFFPQTTDRGKFGGRLCGQTNAGMFSICGHTALVAWKNPSKRGQIWPLGWISSAERSLLRMSQKGLLYKDLRAMHPVGFEPTTPGLGNRCSIP